MIRITKESDYAIMILALMAERDAGMIHSAREVSEWCGLTVPMASKILRCLAREKVLTSHRGANGGYSFERSAEQTSVAEIIRAIEGPISMVQCGADPGVCEQEQVCPTRVNWARINREIEHALERVPISEMYSRPAGPDLLAMHDGCSS